VVPWLALGQPRIVEVPQGAVEQEHVAWLVDAITLCVEPYHDGSVRMIAREGDSLRVEFCGARTGCPIAPATLRRWEVGTVQQFRPSIQHIKAIKTGDVQWL